MEFARQTPGCEIRQEGEGAELEHAAERDRAGEREQGGSGEQCHDHQCAERVVADVPAFGAVDDAAQVGDDLAGTANEGGEAGIGAAGEAPDDARDDQRRHRRPGPDVNLKPRRAGKEAGQRRRRDNRDERPVEQADERIPHLDAGTRGIRRGHAVFLRVVCGRRRHCQFPFQQGRR